MQTSAGIEYGGPELPRCGEKHSSLKGEVNEMAYISPPEEAALSLWLTIRCGHYSHH